MWEGESGWICERVKDTYNGFTCTSSSNNAGKIEKGLFAVPKSRINAMCFRRNVRIDI